MQKTFFYKNHKSFIAFLKKQGWISSMNICDYWFLNKPRLISIFYKKYPDFSCDSCYLDEIETQIRWESELGKRFVEAIKNFLDIEQKRLRENLDLRDCIKNNSTEVDLTKVSVDYQGNLISIEDFCTQFDTQSQISGRIDLRGLPLSKLKIDYISLSNLCFDYSCLSNSHIQQCFLYNVSFANCDLTNSHISLVRIDNQTHFSGCDFSNSFIHIIPITSEQQNKNIGEFKFNKISYLRLIYFAISSLIFNYGGNIESKYTRIIFADVSFYSSNTETKKYFLWLQKIQDRIYKKSNYNLLSNIKFLLELIITKYWSSILSLTFFSVLSIFSFAIPYSNLIIENDNKISYFEAIYHSVTCFTGFGVSNYELNTILLKALSMSENILGYIVLAILIYMLSEKISNKY